MILSISESRLQDQRSYHKSWAPRDDQTYYLPLHDVSFFKLIYLNIHEVFLVDQRLYSCFFLT